MSVSTAYFASLFSRSDDPWGFRTRWYEQRKRDLTLACLPQRCFRSAFEPGCANGELSADLAPRCESLVVSDCDSRALGLASRRLAEHDHVQLLRLEVPRCWPRGHFDLVIISELAYYLDEAQLSRLIACTLDCLLPDAVVLACHWRRPIEGCDLTGDAVHERMHRELGLPCLTQVRDRDFALQVWSTDGCSVAEQEGIT